MAGKGTIIKVHNNRAVIMTDRCEFKEISLKSPALAGDTITYSDEDLRYYTTSYSKIPALVASVLLCCLLVASLLYKPFLGGTYAFISFDINPSFELSVDRSNQVISARSFNQDGQFLLDQTKVTSNPLNQAISQIIRQDCQDGHLDANKMHYIAVSLYFPDDIYDQGFLDNLDTLITKELNDNNLTASIFYFNIDKQTYDKALQDNVSPSRLILWEAAQRSGFRYDLNGNLPWEDSRLTGIASDHACRASRSQARHGMENSTGEMLEQQGQGQPQYRKGRETGHPGQGQNSQAAPETGDANSDQNEPNSTTPIGEASTTNPPPYKQQNGGQTNNTPVDSGSQNSNSPSGSAGTAASDGSGGSTSSGNSNGPGNSTNSGSSNGVGGSGGSSGSGGSAGSGGASSSGGSGGSGDSGGSGGSAGSGR